ncbi:hypothetical protein COV18_05040 [Candidatus Woesearchaeota archaeon CG10_big_fil_rev_8_21_14_0_10_37_12]|nr:MAG: hypothetical protein COV18_05040 [Candidatus Woesearchaeota archaeon CG10_big_fil_rev_8_21_14_0_10_37_12]
MKQTAITTTAILLLFLAGCVIETSKEDTIKLGAIMSLTGFASDYGTNSQKGAQLAVEEINANGGINGKQIELIFEDDRTDGKAAVSGATKLIEIDNVDAIIGGTWDLSLEPIAPLADQHNIIIINPSTGNTKDTRLAKNVFITWPAIKYQVYELEETLTQENITTAVVIRNAGAWSQSQETHLEKLLEKINGSILKLMIGYEVDNNDFRSEISIAKQLNPDLLYLGLGYNDAANVVQFTQEQDFHPVIVTLSGAFEYAIEKGSIKKEHLKKTYIPDVIPNENTEFYKKFETRFGKPPGITADTAYKAVMLLAEAWEKTGTTNTDEVRDYLNSLDFFDENGDAKKPVPVRKIESRTYVE